MSQYPYRWPCRFLDNYDGDTVTLELDRGFYEYKIVDARLDGVDTPELRKVPGLSSEQAPLFKAAAKLARATVFARLSTEAVTLEFLSKKNPGKYGRPLGDVLVNGHSLCQYLLDRHLAVPYDGGDRAALLDAHWQNIQRLQAKGEL